MHSLIVNILYFLSKLFLPKIYVMDEFQTIKKIKEDNCSCVRFGDGEIDFIRSKGKIEEGYQTGSELLSEELKKVLYSNLQSKLIICIPVFFSSDVHWASYTAASRMYWKKYICRNVFSLRQIFKSNTTYGSSQISRPYINRYDITESEKIFNMWKEIFSERDIVIVEGELTRFGVGNDLLGEARTIRRVLCPSVNAFEYTSEICQRCLTFEKNTLFILALGPAAKILAVSLVSQGYQVLDLAHLDIEYEWFLRKSSKKISIPGKYVNESDNSCLQTLINLDSYWTEVVDKIPH